MNKATVWRNGWGTAILAVMLAGPPVFADATFQGLGTTYSYAYAVSADGSVVVGQSLSTSGYEAFRWTQSTGMVGMGDLPPDPPFLSMALAASADGSVVVGEGSGGPTGWEAFRWTSAGMEGLGLGDNLAGGGAYGSRASDVSANGSIVVGSVHSASGREAFRWTQTDGMVGLGDLTEGRFSSQALAVSADGAVTVGHGRSPSGQEAFRWTESSGMVGLGDLAGGAFQSVAFDVSADGSVVVGHGSSESGHEAFYWTAESGMVGLGDLEGGVFYSEAYGVSADGFVVVGSGWSTLRGIEAAIWTTDNGMQAQSLQDLLISAGLDLTGWHLEYATGISADGLTIVGYGSHNGYVEGWIATLPNPSVVPLPGAVLLGGMGLVSSGLYLRRRIT